jgi:hypothetical protein
VGIELWRDAEQHVGIINQQDCVIVGCAKAARGV